MPGAHRSEQAFEVAVDEKVAPDLIAAAVADRRARRVLRGVFVLDADRSFMNPQGACCPGL
jgi:hypothetical protein